MSKVTTVQDAFKDTVAVKRNGSTVTMTAVEYEGIGKGEIDATVDLVFWGQDAIELGKALVKAGKKAVAAEQSAVSAAR